jgi:hypothetical protein
MLRRIWDGLTGWRETRTIKYRDPELYRYLVEQQNIDPDDFAEVGPPK